tara:strand:- start:2452 stop:2706 length:255 start_codon:yes stop_codon:yes gene_type:complete
MSLGLGVFDGPTKNSLRNDGLGRTRHRPLSHSMTARLQPARSSAGAAMMELWDLFTAQFDIGLGLVSVTRALSWLRLWQLLAQE